MNIEKCARRISRKHIGKITVSNVSTYLHKEKGYRVLYIGTPSGDDAIQKYCLQAYIKRKSFTYSDKSKFVFLHNEHDNDDKLSLLLHELGHIELGHLSVAHDPDCINTERQAEVFAYFMQHPYIGINKKMLWFAIISSVVAALSFIYSILLIVKG